MVRRAAVTGSVDCPTNKSSKGSRIRECHGTQMVRWYCQCGDFRGGSKGEPAKISCRGERCGPYHTHARRLEMLRKLIITAAIVGTAALVLPSSVTYAQTGTKGVGAPLTGSGPGTNA